MTKKVAAAGEILELFKGGYLSVAEAIDALEPAFRSQAGNVPQCERCGSHEGARTVCKDCYPMLVAALTTPNTEQRRDGAAHALNEWADLGSNALQWLRNIKDGISIADEALAEMKSNYDRVLAMSRAALPQSPSEASSGAVAWIAFAGNGNVRFWTADPKRAEAEKAGGMDLHTFTLAELVSLSARNSPPMHEHLRQIRAFASTINERNFFDVALHIERQVDAALSREERDHG